MARTTHVRSDDEEDNRSNKENTPLPNRRKSGTGNRSNAMNATGSVAADRRRSSGAGRKDKGKGKARAEEEDEEEEEEEEEVEEVAPTQTQGDELEEDTDIYDPEQDTGEKRQLRKDYRDQIAAAEESRANARDITTEDLVNQLESTNALFGRVRGPSEAVLDSRALMLYADTAAVKARQMKIDADAFDTDDFLVRLRKLMGANTVINDEEDEDEEEEEERNRAAFGWQGWDRIGKIGMKYSLRAPVMDFMFGPLSVEQKKRVVKQRAKETKNEADRTKPTELTEQDIQKSENETTQNLLKIAKVLEVAGGDTGLNYFKFVINPKSFGQTVENMFYVSFLVKEGRVNIDLENEDREPIIYACEQPTEEDYRDDPTMRKRQLVLELTMAEWNDAIDAYDLRDKEPVIPHREEIKGSVQLKGKWY